MDPAAGRMLLMDHTQAAAYLARIGAEPGPATAETLHALQLAHLTTVPFENLSIHLGEPIPLTEDALYDKIVERRRGGFCYEVNGLFAALLTHLGYSLTMHEVRVYWNGRVGAAVPRLPSPTRARRGPGGGRGVRGAAGGWPPPPAPRGGGAPPGPPTRPFQ